MVVVEPMLTCRLLPSDGGLGRGGSLGLDGGADRGLLDPGGAGAAGCGGCRCSAGCALARVLARLASSFVLLFSASSK